MSPSWCAFYEISVSAQFKCYWQRCKRFRKKLLPKEHTICYFNKTKFEEPIHRKSFLARWGTNFCNNGWMLYFLAFIYSLNNLQFVFIFVNNFLQNYNIAKKFGNESNRRMCSWPSIISYILQLLAMFVLLQSLPLHVLSFIYRRSLSWLLAISIGLSYFKYVMWVQILQAFFPHIVSLKFQLCDSK